MKKVSYILLFLFLVTAGAAEDDKNYILRKKILEAKKKIEEFNRKSVDTGKRLIKFKKSNGKRVKKRKSDITTLNSDVSKLDKELKSEKFQNRSLKNSLKNYELQFTIFRNKISKEINSSKNDVKNGFPYNIETRGINISKLISDAEFESISSEEIFNRYFNFLNRELLTGLDSEVFIYNNTKHLRIGWIILAYTDEKGKDAGILSIKNGKWNWETDLDFSMRKAVRDSMKMVEGKKAPDLMEFPIPLSLIRKDIKGGSK